MIHYEYYTNFYRMTLCRVVFAVVQCPSVHAGALYPVVKHFVRSGSPIILVF